MEEWNGKENEEREGSKEKKKCLLSPEKNIFLLYGCCKNLSLSVVIIERGAFKSFCGQSLCIFLDFSPSSALAVRVRVYFSSPTKPGCSVFLFLRLPFANGKELTTTLSLPEKCVVVIFLLSFPNDFIHLKIVIKKLKKRRRKKSTTTQKNKNNNRR